LFHTSQCFCLLRSETNDFTYEVKQAGYAAVGVGMMFFVLMSICGGNAAVARFLEKDKATIHNTKFLAHVSEFIAYIFTFGIVIFDIIVTIAVTVVLQLLLLPLFLL